MLVLSRKRGERIVIGPNIELTVVDIRGNKVRLAVDAPRDVSIHERMVKAHRSSVMEKFNVQSVAKLSRIAEQLHTPGC